MRVLARGKYPEVEALGAECVQHDLRDFDGLTERIKDIDVVFHAASKTGVWGSKESFFSINVTGTENLLKAAQAAKVQRFVYTSSPSATFDGKDAENVTEAQAPYPTHFEAPYPQSKAAAEKLVLQSNSEDFATCALRPHLIWGPRDPHIIPRLIERRKQGRLAQVGDGRNKVAITYIDNAAVAHLQAADVLQPKSENAGKPYFITDGSPVVLWTWINELLEAVGQPRIQRRVSVNTARRVGGVLEWVWRTFGLSGEPPMTRFVASELASSHWYDLSAAKNDFGYALKTSPEEGLKRTIAAFSEKP